MKQRLLGAVLSMFLLMIGCGTENPRSGSAQSVIGDPMPLAPALAMSDQGAGLGPGAGETDLNGATEREFCSWVNVRRIDRPVQMAPNVATVHLTGFLEQVRLIHHGSEVHEVYLEGTIGAEFLDGPAVLIQYHEDIPWNRSARASWIEYREFEHDFGQPLRRVIYDVGHYEDGQLVRQIYQVFSSGPEGPVEPSFPPPQGVDPLPPVEHGPAVEGEGEPGSG